MSKSTDLFIDTDAFIRKNDYFNIPSAPLRKDEQIFNLPKMNLEFLLKQKLPLENEIKINYLSIDEKVAGNPLFDNLYGATLLRVEEWPEGLKPFPEINTSKLAIFRSPWGGEIALIISDKDQRETLPGDRYNVTYEPLSGKDSVYDSERVKAFKFAALFSKPAIIGTVRGIEEFKQPTFIRPYKPEIASNLTPKG